MSWSSSSSSSLWGTILREESPSASLTTTESSTTSFCRSYGKQYILIRKDLGMLVGKMISQGCHASVNSYNVAKENHPELVEKWMKSGQRKIVLKVISEDELLTVKEYCEKNSIPHALIFDEGLTQLKEPAYTALGIGPVETDVEPCTRLDLF